MHPHHAPRPVATAAMLRRLPTCALVAALSLLLLCGAAWAQAQKQKVAVLDLEGIGLTEQEQAALSESLREALLKTGRFIVIDRSQLKNVLDEQALQQATCTGEACASQLGELLGAKRIVAGKAVKLDERMWLVTALMVDVETSETLDLESVRHEGNLVTLMDQQVPQLARRLAGLTEEQAPTPAAPPKAQRKDRKDQQLRLALFPSYLAGENAMRLEQSHDYLVKHVEQVAKRDPDLRLVASFYPSKAFPKAEGRFRSKVDPAQVQQEAWEGLFITTPNERFVFQTGRKLGVDLVFMQRSYHNPERSGGRSYHAYLFDVRALEVYQESGTWPPKKWGSSLREALQRLLAQHRAAR